MIIERLSEDTHFLPISARKEVFFVSFQYYLADKETVGRSQKDKVQSSSSGLYLFYRLMK